MIAGQPPFHAASGGELMAAILRDPVARFPDDAAPIALERAVFRCLEKNRDARFQSAKDLGFALKMPLAVQAPSTSHRPVSPATPTVAVLPFHNLSSDAESEMFADGVTEDVIAHLAKIRSLGVISRTSVASFKTRDQSLREIGKRLAASTIVDGSVRRSGNRVRIVAELVDAEHDRHLWAETYDRDLVDIFAIQTDVALHIADALRAELSADERSRIRKAPTLDLEAYQLYMRGRQYVAKHTESSLRQGIDYFERATERDRDFALAYVGVARTYAEAVVSGNLAIRPEAAFRVAKEAVDKALAIDDRLGDAHAIVASSCSRPISIGPEPSASSSSRFS